MPKYEVTTDKGKYLVETETITPQPQPQQQDIRATKMIPQFTKGLYDAKIPFTKTTMGEVAGNIGNLLERINPSFASAEEMRQQMTTTPRAQGFLPQFARGLGAVAPDLAMSAPFMRGAKLIPKIPQIAKSALGFGAYGGAKAAIEGQPILPSALSSAGSAALFHGAGKVGATLMPKSIPFGGRIASSLSGGFVGGMTGGEEGMALGTGLGALYPSTPLDTNKVARGIINYSLKPDRASKRYGADPVSGLVNEPGLWGANWKETGERVQSRIGELQDYKHRVKLDAKNNQAKIDYTGVFKPLLELRNELSKDHDVHASIIKEIDTNIKSLGSGVNLRSLDIDTAFDLQSRVKRMEPTQFERVSNQLVAKKLRQVYHAMGEAIKNNPNVSPELRTILKRIHNLSATQEAIIDATNRNSGFWNLIPMGMFGYGLYGGQPWLSALVAGRAALKTPAVSTTLGRLLGQKYPKIP